MNLSPHGPQYHNSTSLSPKLPESKIKLPSNQGANATCTGCKSQPTNVNLGPLFRQATLPGLTGAAAGLGHVSGKTPGCILQSSFAFPYLLHFSSKQHNGI